MQSSCNDEKHAKLGGCSSFLPKRLIACAGDGPPIN